MEIRKYTKGDKKEIIPMISGILKEIFNGDPAEFKILREFNVTKNYIHYIVIIIGEKIVGIGALKKLTGKKVRIKRLYVMEDYRRRGIAQKILDELIQFAKEQNFKEILFKTYPIMENARKFHKRNGFVETKNKDPYQIHLVKKL
ncbi:GNAT family N-acetyltransferase [Candidatus Pacearchaeota archaeon]|nr:GNAT family N-acetyltransferase [Candidatus Pacearchaeota archaeon]